MNFKPIKTQRLEINLFEEKHLPELFRYRSDPSVFLFYSIEPKSIDELAVYLRDNITEFDDSNGYSVFCILLNNKVIGDISVKYWGFENKINALGFAIDPAYQNNGYAFEAVSSLITYIFLELNRNRIQATVDPKNKKSIKLLERLGFEREGIIKEVVYSNGIWEDEYLYALIKSDWERKNQKIS